MRDEIPSLQNHQFGHSTDTQLQAGDKATPHKVLEFLTLPFEIRELILIHAFRREIIHIHELNPMTFLDRGKHVFTYSIRCPPHLNRVSQHSDSVTGPTKAEKLRYNNLLRCHDTGRMGMKRHRPGPSCPSRLPIELLRTCQQMYWEASQVLWSINTFHFDNPIVFGMAITRFPAKDIAALRNLSLTLNPRYPLFPHWSAPLEAPFLRLLRGVRTLKVEFQDVGCCLKRLQGTSLKDMYDTQCSISVDWPFYR